MALRKRPRFTAELPVSFSGKNISGKGTLLDISIEGCGVSTNTSPTYPSLLTLRIHLDADDSPLVIASAAVRWSTDQEFRVEFLKIGTAELARLQAFVKTLEENPGP